MDYLNLPSSLFPHLFRLYLPLTLCSSLVLFLSHSYIQLGCLGLPQQVLAEPGDQTIIWCIFKLRV